MNKRLPKLKKRTWLLIVTGLYLLLVNTIWPARMLTAMILDWVGVPGHALIGLSGDLQYTTLHGEYTNHQETFIIFSNGWETVWSGFQNYKRCHPSSPDTVLYRTYSFKPYMFWEVGSYLTQPWWKLPYLLPEQVKPRLKLQPINTCLSDTNVHSPPPYAVGE